MTPAEHLAKAQRVERTLHKLAPGDDYLAIIDGAMIAGYHWGSAILHREGVLANTEHRSTPSKLDVPINRLPPAAQPAFTAFAELERLRFDYVRNPSRAADGLEDRVWRALEVMRRTSEAVNGER